MRRVPAARLAQVRALALPTHCRPGFGQALGVETARLLSAVWTWWVAVQVQPWINSSVNAERQLARAFATVAVPGNTRVVKDAS